MKNDMFNIDEPVILAISGGRDSMCLLDMYYRSGQRIIVCHTNHHQRKASDTEEKFLIEYCKERNIALEIDEYFPLTKENFQAEAHIHRYEFFYETALKYKAKYILTAHHKDDLAETVLLRLIQGSNLYGYGGISRITKYKDVYLYRPLLNYSREEITKYCKNHNVFYFDDESNAENHYMRNRIRHQILPLLKEENPNILNTISNFSNICKEAFTHIRNETIKYLDDNSNQINLESFKSLDIGLKKDIICYMLENLKIKTSYQQILDILELIDNPKPQLEYNLKNGILLYKRYDTCYFAKEKKNLEISVDLNLNDEALFANKYLFRLQESEAPNGANVLKICYNDLALPLKIRTRKPGDAIKLKYGTKKLKDLFIDKKIDKEARNNIPIVTDSKDNVLWVYGVAKKNPEAMDKLIYLTCEEKYGK